MRRLLIAFAVTALVAGPGPSSFSLGDAGIAGSAAADPVATDFVKRFERGDYLNAADLAEARETADDLAFAARSVLAYCMTRDSPPDPALVTRARSDAERALRLDPRHAEGRLQLAIALSLQSRDMGLMDAWRSGAGQKGRVLAESVLGDSPDNHFAHGFLAVWNLEVRRRGGTIGARWMGASIDAARSHYEAAVRLAPEDVGVRWQYARALVALDVGRYGGEALSALKAAAAAPADEHVERVMQIRAERLQRLLEGDELPEAQSYALATL
ncbi:hypothetical protein GC169_13475 [bacterium]|nr:hypothetical protein [bacterium]